MHRCAMGIDLWRRMSLAFSVVLTGLFALPSNANVTRGEPRNGVATSDYNAVGMLSHTDTPSSATCSAVAVLDGQHILTARHCVTTGGSILGTTRNPSGFRFHANGVTYQGTELFADFTGDLALIRLDGVVPDAYDLWDTQTNGTESGLTFRGVGFGATDPDGDGRWGPGGEGTKRTFTNTIDSITNGAITGQGPVLRYDFDLAPAPTSGGGSVGTGEFEGLHGPGDSGGAALIVDPLDGSTLLLAGLMSSAGDPVNGSTGSLVQVSAYRNDIIASVPEPSTLLLLAGISVVCLNRRRASIMRCIPTTPIE